MSQEIVRISQKCLGIYQKKPSEQVSEMCRKCVGSVCRTCVGNVSEMCRKCFEIRVSISIFLIVSSSFSLVVSYCFFCVSLILLIQASISLAKFKKLQTLAKIQVFLIQQFRCSLMCFITVRGLYHRFLAFPRGPGGFRKVREAGRKHFHLSWYL